MIATGYKIKTEQDGRFWKYAIFYEGVIVRHGDRSIGGRQFITEDAAFDDAEEHIVRWVGSTEGMGEPDRGDA